MSAESFTRPEYATGELHPGNSPARFPRCGIRGLRSHSVTPVTQATSVHFRTTRCTMSQPTAARSDGLRRVATGTGATLALAAVAVTATGGAAHADEQLHGPHRRHRQPHRRPQRDHRRRDRPRERPGGRVPHPDRPGADDPDARPPRRGRRAAPQPPPAAAAYTVVSGDTVGRIAARLRHDASPAVVAANGLDARALIRIGQTLTDPGRRRRRRPPLRRPPPSRRPPAPSPTRCGPATPSPPSPPSTAPPSPRSSRPTVWTRAP